MNETDTFTGIYNSSHYTVTNQFAGKINVSRLDLTITGLPHFTEYQILVSLFKILYICMVKKPVW
jgi:hypothetical protein